jgi:hypothetical protein
MCALVLLAWALIVTGGIVIGMGMDTTGIVVM